MGWLRDTFGGVDRETADEYRDLITRWYDGDESLDDDERHRLIQMEREMPRSVRIEIEGMPTTRKWVWR